MCKGKILWQFDLLSKFTRICMAIQVIQAWLGGKSCFSHTNPSNFQWLLQLLLFRYTAEYLQVTYFYYALSVPANKFIQKQTVLVFIKSWSCDQLLQKTY